MKNENKVFVAVFEIKGEFCDIRLFKTLESLLKWKETLGGNKRFERTKGREFFVVTETTIHE